jgi:hypothetical protein
MTIGTGIFLSALFIGFVALVIGTRDKWKWGRIFVRTAIALVLLAGIAGAGFYTYYQLEQRPTKALELAGIRLGDTEADVKFKKGKPAASKEDRWLYDGSDYSNKFWIIVTFDYGKVSQVELSPHESGSVPFLQDIGKYSTVETVIEKFGEPSLTSNSADDASRILSFRKYNLAFEFQKNAVKRIMIFEGLLKPGLQFVESSDSAPTDGIKPN